MDDAIPSTSTGQSSIRTEENQWFHSWEALNEFKQNHDTVILFDKIEIVKIMLPTQRN